MTDDAQLQKTVSVSEGKNIIYVRFLEQVINKIDNVRRSALAIKKVTDIIDFHKGKSFKILVTMLEMGESHISKESYKPYIGLLKRKEISKVAIVGNFKKQLKVLSFITPFIVGEGEKVSWFSNEAEAMLWFEKV